MLDDPLAEAVARREAVAALVPAQAIHDALARLGGQTLQYLLGRKPAELDEDRAHLVPALLGFGEQEGELALVDDALGAQERAQRLLTQIGIGGDHLPAANVEILANLAVGKAERAHGGGFGQVEDQARQVHVRQRARADGVARGGGNGDDVPRRNRFVGLGRLGRGWRRFESGQVDGDVAFFRGPKFRRRIGRRVLVLEPVVRLWLFPCAALLHRLRLAEAVQDRPDEIVGLQGFGQKARPHLLGQAAGQGRILVDPRGHDDGDFLAERGFANRTTEGKAVHGRHVEIRDDEVGSLRHEHGQALLSAGGLDHARLDAGQARIAADQTIHRLARDGIVFNEEDGLCHYSAGVSRTAWRSDPRRARRR